MAIAMDLLFLGTGAGVPSKLRNVTSICLRLLQERQSVWMFDCGEGTQQQILHYPVKLRYLDKLFVTHLHGDHIFGIPGLLSTRSSQGVETPLTIYGPHGIKRFVDTALAISQTHLTYDIEFHEISTGGIIHTDAGFTVEAGFLDHTIASLGYRITENQRSGRLDVARLRQLGVPEGPLYGKLKNGHDIHLDDGSIVRAEDVVARPVSGRIVTILGDTRRTTQSTLLSKDASVLVHEATFGEDSAKLAPVYGHSTASDAAAIASEAQVQELILTHISQRYTSETSETIAQEAKQTFPHTTLAYDGLSIDIPLPLTPIL